MSRYRRRTITLHNLPKKRARKTFVVQADSEVMFHNITSSFSLVTNYELCLACQHFISNRTNHKLRKKLANQNALGVGRTEEGSISRS